MRSLGFIFPTAALVPVAYDPPVGLVFAGLPRVAPLGSASSELETRRGCSNATPATRCIDNGVTG